MTLIHRCDICEKEQKARPVLAGIKLEDGKTIKSEDETCLECDSVAEMAKDEALQKRKKKV